MIKKTITTLSVVALVADTLAFPAAAAGIANIRPKMSVIGASTENRVVFISIAQFP